MPNPPQPAAFSAVTAGQLQANWTANGNPPLTNYQAVLSTGSSPSTNGFAGNFVSTTTNLSATFTPLIPNTTYFVDVKDFNGGVSSVYTPLGSTITWANPPAVGTSPVVLSTQITANWGTGNNPPGTTYVAEISLDSDFNSVVGSTMTAHLSFAFTGLASNTAYFMHVQAINGGNIPTTFTSLGSTITLANLPVAAPSVVLSTQITANWTSGGNPLNTMYIAQISTDSNFTTFAPITTLNLFSTFTGLTPNTTYFMRVQALNSAGSPTSFVPLGSTITLANLPVAASSVVLSTQITANWTSGGNPLNTMYIAQISTDFNFTTSTASITTNLFCHVLQPHSQHRLFHAGSGAQFRRFPNPLCVPWLHHYVGELSCGGYSGCLINTDHG